MNVVIIVLSYSCFCLVMVLSPSKLCFSSLVCFVFLTVLNLIRSFSKKMYILFIYVFIFWHMQFFWIVYSSELKPDIYIFIYLFI